MSGVDQVETGEGSSGLAVENVDQSQPDQRSTWDRVRTWAVAAAPAVTALLVTVWVFRDVLFGGRLPGDVGDARWTLGLHEHWFQVWGGQESIRDLPYYFPLKATLGTSDAFLVQGQIYSVARLLGVGILYSWVVAQVLFFAIGALGVAVLAKRLLALPLAQVAFVALSCASYPVLMEGGHIQLIGFLACSWVMVGLHDVVTGRNVLRGLALLFLVPPILALSSWYAVILLLVVLAFLGAFLLLFSSWRGIVGQVRGVCVVSARALWSPVGGVLVLCFVAVWALVLWIYLPSRSLLPASGWGDLIAYGPRWSDLVNAAAFGGGLWSGLYEKVFDLSTFNGEQALGFTPILLASFGVAGLVLLRQAVVRTATVSDDLAVPQRPGRTGLLAVWFTVLAVLAFFVIDERGFSFYRIVWETVPGMESVRAPFRVQAILYSLAILLVLRALELWWARSTGGRTDSARRWVLGISAALLMILIGIEMQRGTYTIWSPSQVLAPALQDKVAQVQESCDAVVVLDEDPTDPSWVNAIDAVVFSAISAVPTPQGYSRADPIGHPGLVASGEQYLQWMQSLGFEGRLCTVSSTSVEVIS